MAGIHTRCLSYLSYDATGRHLKFRKYGKGAHSGYTSADWKTVCEQVRAKRAQARFEDFRKASEKAVLWKPDMLQFPADLWDKVAGTLTPQPVRLLSYTPRGNRYPWLPWISIPYVLRRLQRDRRRLFAYRNPSGRTYGNRVSSSKDTPLPKPRMGGQWTDQPKTIGGQTRVWHVPKIKIKFSKRSSIVEEVTRLGTSIVLASGASTWRLDCFPELVHLMRALVADAEDVMVSLYRLTSKCTWCGRALSDSMSSKLLLGSICRREVADRTRNRSTDGRRVPDEPYETFRMMKPRN